MERPRPGPKPKHWQTYHYRHDETHGFIPVSAPAASGREVGWGEWLSAVTGLRAEKLPAPGSSALEIVLVRTRAAMRVPRS